NVDALPADLKIPEPLKSRLTYVRSEELLIWRGIMTPEERDELLKVSNDFNWQSAVLSLYRFSDFRRQLPKLRGNVDPGTWPGIILGEGVAHISKNRQGKLEGRSPTLYRVPVKLTVLGIPPGGTGFNIENKSEQPYWVVDDSRTKVYQYDSQTVYVSFEQLQRDLSMTEQKGEDGSVAFPARTSEIDVRVKPGVSLDVARDKIDKACQSVIDDQIKEGNGALRSYGGFVVQTW